MQAGCRVRLGIVRSPLLVCIMPRSASGASARDTNTVSANRGNGQHACAVTYTEKERERHRTQSLSTFRLHMTMQFAVVSAKRRSQRPTCSHKSSTRVMAWVAARRTCAYLVQLPRAPPSGGQSVSPRFILYAARLNALALASQAGPRTPDATPCVVAAASEEGVAKHTTHDTSG